MASDPAESVSAVNCQFVQGLSDRYVFIPLRADRKYGTTRQARLNCINGFYFLKQCALWLAYLAKHRPDIAHYALSSGWAMEKSLLFLKLARLMGTKTVGHLHSGSFIEFWGSVPQWRRRAALCELRKLDALVVLSESWRENVATHIGLPRDRLFVVNNPIGEAFEESALQMPVRRDTCTVLSLGTMGRPKGVLDILAAVKLARECASMDLKLVGPEREPGVLAEVRRYVTDNSLDDVVDIQPGVWGQEKIDLYRNASIFVLPSYYENFPLVVLEAAAAGLAIVTTAVGAIPEFFEDGVSALFVEPGNVRQIADALVTLYQHPDERCRLGQAARDVFTTRLGRARIMEAMHDVYGGL